MFAEERTKLGSMVHSKDFTRRIRASIVLESSRGSIVSRIAQELDVNKHTARLWIRRFNESGIDGLTSRSPPGRPPTISSEQKDAIVRVALTDPRSLGMNFTTWSLSAMRSYLERNQIVRRISESWIRKILIKKGSSTSGARGGRQAATPIMTRR
ncbi:MAG: helix-turn-helix domain-containing protein [Nitrososphaerales archaeon]